MQIETDCNLQLKCLSNFHGNDWLAAQIAVFNAYYASAVQLCQERNTDVIVQSIAR